MESPGIMSDIGAMSAKAFMGVMEALDSLEIIRNAEARGTEYYVMHYMNCFDHECYERIAEVAEFSPFLAGVLGVMKAVLEFFQEIVISPLMLVEELVKLSGEEGMGIKVVFHLGGAIISPLTGLFKTAVRACYMIIGPTDASAYLADKYKNDIENFETQLKNKEANIALSDDTYVRSLADQFIQDNNITDPLVQKIVVEEFKRKQGRQRINPHKELEELKNIFRGDPENKEIKSRIRNNDECWDCTSVFFKDFISELPENQKNSKLVKWCAAVEFQNLLDINLDTHLDTGVIFSKLKEGSFADELKAKLVLKLNNYHKIASQYCDEYEILRKKIYEEILQTKDDILHNFENVDLDENNRQSKGDIFNWGSKFFPLKLLKSKFIGYQKQIIDTPSDNLDAIIWEEDFLENEFINRLVSEMGYYCSKDTGLMYLHLFKILGYSCEQIIILFSLPEMRIKVHEFISDILYAPEIYNKFYGIDSIQGEKRLEELEQLIVDNANKHFEAFKKVIDFKPQTQNEIHKDVRDKHMLQIKLQELKNKENKSFDETCKECFFYVMSNLPDHQFRNKFIEDCLVSEWIKCEGTKEATLSKIEDGSLHKELMQMIELKEIKYNEMAGEYLEKYANLKQETLEEVLQSPKDKIQNFEIIEKQEIDEFNCDSKFIALKALKDTFIHCRKQIIEKPIDELHEVIWENKHRQ